MTARYAITFKGRVQGVGFRATAAHIARSFPIAGWVRNEPDGSVLCVVEGNDADIDAFLEAVQSRMARNITATSKSPAPAEETLQGFSIRY